MSPWKLTLCFYFYRVWCLHLFKEFRYICQAITRINHNSFRTGFNPISAVKFSFGKFMLGIDAGILNGSVRCICTVIFRLVVLIRNVKSSFQPGYIAICSICSLCAVHQGIIIIISFAIHKHPCFLIERFACHFSQHSQCRRCHRQCDLILTF